mgnify:CR=1 FL=1
MENELSNTVLLLCGFPVCVHDVMLPDFFGDF